MFCAIPALFLALSVQSASPVAAGTPPPPAMELAIPSTADGTSQPCLAIPSTRRGPQPLLVALHPWSHGYNTYDMSDWRNAAVERGWHVIFPHFRGPNKQPDACASALARQDVLDATAYACEHWDVDERRIYLAGGSGGGHMAMAMAAHAPHVWAGVSAWVGISDLAAWHRECKAAGRKYWRDIEGVVGGAPGASAEVDEQLQYRSPIHHLAAAKDLPMDLNAGIHDGHTGSVPIHHTLDAFNVLAQALGAAPVTDEEIATLSKEEPLASREEQDATYGRMLYLRRTAGPSRVSIFEGGHQAIPTAACKWLARQRRPVER